jgi:hypothetical protein
MNDKPPKSTEQERREQRLAKALRDNLRRRKALAAAKPKTPEPEA